MNGFDKSRLESSPGPVRSGTLAEMLNTVKDQLNFECFDKEYLEQADEICLIIAEIFILPPSATVQISGNKLTAEAVRDVYSRLRHEDVITVMDNFEAATYEIRFKKTYLRTALYNEVFERSSRGINDLRTHLPEYATTRRENIQHRSRRSTRYG